MNGASGGICLGAKSSTTGATLGDTRWSIGPDGDLLDAAWGSRISSIQDVVGTQWGLEGLPAPWDLKELS